MKDEPIDTNYDEDLEKITRKLEEEDKPFLELIRSRSTETKINLFLFLMFLYDIKGTILEEKTPDGQKIYMLYLEYQNRETGDTFSSSLYSLDFAKGEIK